MAGLEAVAEQFKAAQIHPTQAPASAQQPKPIEWGDPGEIAVGPEEQPYPINALPPIVAQAVKEFQAYGKQPLPMIATAALGQMALVAQGYADVARDSRLRSPCSLNVLIIGESGERKTAIDTAFSEGAQRWQMEEHERLYPAYKKGKAMEMALTERQKKIRTKIAATEDKKNLQSEQTRIELEERLQELVQQEIDLNIKPVPVLHYEDVTNEGLSYALSVGHPSGMLASDEGGIVLNGKGMSDESSTSFLATLNRLWDGKGLNQTRKVAKSANMVGRRFSTSLMIQGELLQGVIDKGGRGIGFFGRYLIACPQSTMGTRLYTPPNNDLPALKAFNNRSHELLSQPLPVNERYELIPPVMQLDRAAHAAWVEYHNAVETQLSVYGDLALVRDLGAKSAENASRIAAVLQIWNEGPGGNITHHYMEAGITLAAWHLNEAGRLFFEASKPQEMQNAEKLSHWLSTEGQKHIDQDGSIPLRVILQRGPNPVRNQKDRDEAIKILGHPDINHLRITLNGRKKGVVVNPKLLNI